MMSSNAASASQAERLAALLEAKNAYDKNVAIIEKLVADGVLTSSQGEQVLTT